MRTLWFFVTASAVLGFSTEGTAQVVPGTNAVLFAINGSAKTASMSSGLAPLQDLGRADLTHFSPFAVLSAEKIHADPALNVILGDFDGDDVHFENYTGGFDAMEILRIPPPPLITRSVFNYVFSSPQDFGSVTSGSIYRFIYNGIPPVTIDTVLDEALVVAAIGQVAGNRANTDAFAQSLTGDLFLSFADDESVNGPVLEDGGVVMIPAAAVTYAPSGRVTAITPGSAVIVLSEASVDAMVANAGLTFAVTVGDLTCLAIDLNGGNFMGDDGVLHENLAFSGENCGAVVLSTENGGRIAAGNFGSQLGAPNGNPFALGMSAFSGHIDAMTLREDTGRALTVDVADGEVDFPGETFVQWQIGNAVPNSSVLFFVGVQPTFPGHVPPSAPIGGKVFPGFYALPPIANLMFSVPTDSNGIASVTGTLTHPLIPLILVGQAYDPGVPFLGFPEQLSAPASIWFP